MSEAEAFIHLTEDALRVPSPRFMDIELEGARVKRRAWTDEEIKAFRTELWRWRAIGQPMQLWSERLFGRKIVRKGILGRLLRVPLHQPSDRGKRLSNIHARTD